MFLFETTTLAFLGSFDLNLEKSADLCVNVCYDFKSYGVLEDFSILISPSFSGYEALCCKFGSTKKEFYSFSFSLSGDFGLKILKILWPKVFFCSFSFAFRTF